MGACVEGVGGNVGIRDKGDCFYLQHYSTTAALSVQGAIRYLYRTGLLLGGSKPIIELNQEHDTLHKHFNGDN